VPKLFPLRSNFTILFQPKKNMTTPDRSRVRDATPPPKGLSLVPFILHYQLQDGTGTVRYNLNLGNIKQLKLKLIQKLTNLCASPVAHNLNACFKCGFLAELL